MQSDKIGHRQTPENDRLKENINLQVKSSKESKLIELHSSSRSSRRGGERGREQLNQINLLLHI